MTTALTFSRQNDAGSRAAHNFLVLELTPENRAHGWRPSTRFRLVLARYQYSNLRKKPTFRDATTGFATTWRLKKQVQKFYAGGNLLHPIRSTTHIRVVTRHQYGISALVSQTSFRGETSGGVAKLLAVFSGYQYSTDVFWSQFTTMDTQRSLPVENAYLSKWHSTEQKEIKTVSEVRGTQGQYSSKPLKRSIVKRILVFKR